MKDFVLLTVVPSLAAALIRILGRLRPPFTSAPGPSRRLARGENAILAFWHGQLFMMPHMCLGRPLDVMISSHRDGEMIARTMVHFGFGAVRGSSTRGGSRGAERRDSLHSRGSGRGRHAGRPEGAARVVQPGVIELARSTGAPIFPVAYGVRKKKLFVVGQVRRSLPLLREPLRLGRGGPRSREADAESREIFRKKLEKELNRISLSADRFDAP